MDQKYQFWGEFEHTLDPKGRIIIPSKYREPLGNHVYLIKSWDKECIALFRRNVWENMMQEYLSQTNLFDEEEQEFKRLLASSVEDQEVDKQGRVFIPQKLREYAGIESSVTILGVHDHLEIWNPEKWQKEKEKKPIKELARQVEGRLKGAYTRPSG
jgi:MraZ protein